MPPVKVKIAEGKIIKGKPVKVKIAEGKIIKGKPVKVKIAEPNKTLEQRCRRLARKQGRALQKSRTRAVEKPSYGIYYIVDDRGLVEATFSSIQEVDVWLKA